MAPRREHTSKALRYGTRSQGISQFYLYTLTEWTIPAFAFPAEAGTHLPIPEGWKAELAWVAGWLQSQTATWFIAGIIVVPHVQNALYFRRKVRALQLTLLCERTSRFSRFFIPLCFEIKS